MARYVWQEKSVRSVGVNDPSVSNFCKAWIIQGTTTVVGVIGEGTSKELTSNWDSPFEGDAVGSKVEKVGGLVQSTTDMTSVTTLNSRQVWNGSQPHTFNLALQLYALADAKREVDDAIMELERMASPELNAVSPVGGATTTGRIPGQVQLNIGRNVLIGPCVITSVSVPLDGPRSHDGYLMSALVNIGIQSYETINKSAIASTYG